MNRTKAPRPATGTHAAPAEARGEAISRCGRAAARPRTDHPEYSEPMQSYQASAVQVLPT
jgi:hypothetical protein